MLQQEVYHERAGMSTRIVPQVAVKRVVWDCELAPNVCHGFDKVVARIGKVRANWPLSPLESMSY